MRKLLPYPIIYVEQIEKWLNKMSLDGKHLVKLNRLYATFEEGESRDIKYAVTVDRIVNRQEGPVGVKNVLRSDMSKDAIIDKLDRYKDKGWQLLYTNIKPFTSFVFFEKTICTVYKSEGEPKEYVRAGDDHKKSLFFIRQSTAIILLGIMVTLTIAMNVYAFAVSSSLNTLFPDLYFYRAIRALLVCIPVAVFAYWFLKLLRLVKVYASKKETYKPPFKGAHILSLLIIIAAISIIAWYNPRHYIQSSQNVYLGDVEHLVNLEVIAGERTEDYSAELFDDYYDGYVNSTLFMPLHYEVGEDAVLDSGEEMHYSVEYTKSCFKKPIERFTHSGPDYFARAEKKQVVFLYSSYFNEVSYLYFTKGNEEKVPSFVMYLIRDYDYYVVWHQGYLSPKEIAENIEKYCLANESEMNK